jgi:hypothetical protein
MEFAALMLILGSLGGLLCFGIIVVPWTYILGARVVGIDKPSFLKAFITALLAGIAASIVTSIVGLVPILGSVLALIASIVVPAIAIQLIFETTFGKALIIELISFAICTVVAGILVVTLLLAGVTFGAVGEAFDSATRAFN